MTDANQLTRNLVEGAVRCSFSAADAKKLKVALGELVTLLKSAAAAKAEGGKPKPVKSMDYQYTGEIFLEIFCNPNIWPSPYAAKLLITIRDDRIRLTTEAELTRILEDVNLYLEAHA